MPLFKRKQPTGTAGKTTHVFFSTDLHGSTVCFKKFINAADFYGANVLIMGGDTTGMRDMGVRFQVKTSN